VCSGECVIVCVSVFVYFCVRVCLLERGFL
jgi:hypothetical protein